MFVLRLFYVGSTSVLVTHPVLVLYQYVVIVSNSWSQHAFSFSFRDVSSFSFFLSYPTRGHSTHFVTSLLGLVFVTSEIM